MRRLGESSYRGRIKMLSAEMQKDTSAEVSFFEA